MLVDLLCLMLPATLSSSSPAAAQRSFIATMPAMPPACRGPAITRNVSPRIRHPLQSEDSPPWSRRSGFRHRLPAVVEHRPNLAERVAHDVGVAQLQGAVLHQHAGNRTAAAIQLGLDHRAHSWPVGLGLLWIRIRNKADHLFQIVEMQPLLGRDLDKLRGASPLGRLQPAVRQLLLHPVRIRVGLVDLVHRHDDRHVRRLRVVDRFQRLRHHAIVRRHYDDNDIRDLRAAGAHPRKRFVPRRIQEHNLAPERRRIRLRDLHLVRADVLRNSASLTRRDIGRSDRIQQGSLAMIYVARMMASQPANA